MAETQEVKIIVKDKRQANLIPQAHVLTVEEQSKGGKASVNSRRLRKRAKEVADVLLALPISKGDLIELEELQAINEDTNTDVITGIVCSIIKKALDGDLRASQLLFTLTGEYSTRYNLQASGVIRDESLERFEEDIAEYFTRGFNRPRTAEEIQTEEELQQSTTMMFKYYCMRDEVNSLARNFTSDDIKQVQELFNTAGDGLKEKFIRRCYGTDGKYLKTDDCITLYDTVYKPKVLKE